MRINIIDAFVSVILVFLLVPKLGIYGYVVTVFATEILNFFLSMNKLGTISKVKIDTVQCILKPLYCVTGAVCMPKVVIYLLGVSLNYSTLCIVCIISSCVLYFFALMIMECITKEDILKVKRLFYNKKTGK